MTTNQTNIFTIENVAKALESARVRYVEVNGYAHDAQSDDLNKAGKHLTAEVCNYAGALMLKGEIDQQRILDAIAGTLPVKATMRMGEMFARLLMTKGSDRTTLLATCGALVGATARSAVHFAVSGKGDENTSVTLCAIPRRCASFKPCSVKSGVTTVATQLSRSFGINGFCNVLGMGSFEKGKAGEEMKLEVKRGNVFVQAIKKYAEGASETTLKLNAGGKDKSESK
jgi:hypothetical protein